MTDDPHYVKIARIAGELRARIKDQRPVRISKGGVSHFVPLPGDSRNADEPIDISCLDRILEIDEANHTCTAEPGVTFAALIAETLKHGLLPAVVPELEGITVGGAIAGCSVEAMSYRYGGFHDSCLEYEIISGAGEIMTCSPKSEPMLFEMIHGSYGTLGILTKAAFSLVPAKRFVKMEYRHHQDFAAFYSDMSERLRAGDHDFIDAIIHAPDHLVLCLGDFVDSAPFLSSYRWLDIFYKSTRTLNEDYLTTQDYCFRYDAECHWLTRTMPLLENRLFRLLFGKLYLGSTKLIRWSRRLERLLRLKKRPEVVCDVFIPARNMAPFFEWYVKVFDFFPLWVVPYRMPKPYAWISAGHARRIGEELQFDCAIYGKANNRDDMDFSQALEKKTFELDGIKTLISRNHYTEEEFWRIYNKENYLGAKRRLDPEGLFPGIFEKMCRRKGVA